jgi:hypothetical protein
MNDYSPVNTWQTDWERLDALQDNDINLTDAPEISPEMFAKSVARHGLKTKPAKQQVTLQIDDSA